MHISQLFPNKNSLQLLGILADQCDPDDPRGAVAYAIITAVTADLVLLREIKHAARQLANLVADHGTDVVLSTETDTAIQIIRGSA